MRKIRIAQIGLNQYSHSLKVLRSLCKQSDIFDFVGYALPEGEKERLPKAAAEIAAAVPEMTLEQILTDPTIEAVAVETDEIYLTKYAIMAAEHGKHIHMEKPGGRELEDFRKLIEIVQKNGKVFHTGYMYRYNPFIQELLEQAKRGDLGEILSVEAQMNCFHPAAMREWLKDLPGGMMFYLGCHLVDLIYQLQGMPEEIIPLNKCSGVSGVTGEDQGFAAFVYPNGVSFAKTSAVELGGFERRQLVVTGTKATVELKPLEWHLPGTTAQSTARTVRTNEGWYVPGVTEYSPTLDRYDGMMASFAAMVRGEKTNPYTPEYELALYELVLRACGL